MSDLVVGKAVKLSDKPVLHQMPDFLRQWRSVKQQCDERLIAYDPEEDTLP